MHYHEVLYVRPRHTYCPKHYDLERATCNARITCVDNREHAILSYHYDNVPFAATKTGSTVGAPSVATTKQVQLSHMQS
jgi:hypothetical protein